MPKPCRRDRQRRFSRRACGRSARPWHTTPKLRIFANLSLLPLPPRSPELNPLDNLWPFLRQTFLSNRVFESYEAILDAACHAWNAVRNAPGRIMSIGLREWAHTGQ